MAFLFESCCTSDGERGDSCTRGRQRNGFWLATDIVLTYLATPENLYRCSTGAIGSSRLLHLLTKKF
ncbi:hypothetical protein [Aulosira sp. FACHB-615]|uniref:hypothetical protein n=1 Tax=Aulosira sp. FACHB-615 TaxID=2692777 RepID=UPI00168397AC|nr:hypothetical protein [Aulosira sp. FACHB-615]